MTRSTSGGHMPCAAPGPAPLATASGSGKTMLAVSMTQAAVGSTQGGTPPMLLQGMLQQRARSSESRLAAITNALPLGGASWMSQIPFRGSGGGNAAVGAATVSHGSQLSFWCDHASMWTYRGYRGLRPPAGRASGVYDAGGCWVRKGTPHRAPRKVHLLRARAGRRQLREH